MNRLTTTGRRQPASSKSMIAGLMLQAALFTVPAMLPGAARAADSPESDAAAGTFVAGEGTFLLDGEPWQVVAAELHYPRIPREYWEHRIRMCSALGVNTVCLYVFWNVHEPEEGAFDFTGQNDLRAFVQLCRANGLKVILRPGPYVCAEWEMGGLPWWLLKDADIGLRSNDSRFISRVERFEEAVAGQVADLTVSHGGPIIMIQVENEYGSYGVDKPYVANIRDIIRRHFGRDVTLFQCDWASNFELNGLDDVLWTMNFGTGANIDDQFSRLRELRPTTPLMCSEFWSGWFDEWGVAHETRPADDMIAGIDEMLSKGVSLSLYMTHGGTNWGHWAGANSPGYAPHVTSYDYDAPINEQGAPTEKYRKLRELMRKYRPAGLPTVPETPRVDTVAAFRFTEVAPLFDNLPESVGSSRPMAMEELGQGFGSVLYSTLTPATGKPAVLTVDEAHDYAQVWLDGQFIGKLDRREGEKTLQMPRLARGQRLDILVEATGRVNFGLGLTDRKGIIGSVTLADGEDEQRLTDWQIYPLPDRLGFYQQMAFRPLTDADTSGPRLPGVYRATFEVGQPADTYLNLEGFGKGLVYLNGHALGRFWEIGPQQTLYTPGPWLQPGRNEIVVFDVIGPHSAVSRGESAPIIDRLRR